MCGGDQQCLHGAVGEGPGPQRGRDDSAHPPLGVSGPHVFQEDVWDFQVSVISAPGPGNDDKRVGGLERLSAGRAPGSPQPPTPNSTIHGTQSSSGCHSGRLHPKPGSLRSGPGPGAGPDHRSLRLLHHRRSGSAGWPIPGALLPPGVTAWACTLGPSPLGHAGVVCKQMR